jgi:hypothetical protein
MLFFPADILFDPQQRGLELKMHLPILPLQLWYQNGHPFEIYCFRDITELN